MNFSFFGLLCKNQYKKKLIKLDFSYLNRNRWKKAPRFKLDSKRHLGERTYMSI